MTTMKKTTTSMNLPKSKILLPKSLGVSAFLLPLFAFSSAYSANRAWDGTTGNWDVDANWSSDIAPTSSDTAVITNGGTALLPTGISGSYGDLYIGTAFGGSGTINISGGVLTAATSALLGYSTGSQGTAIVSGGTWTNADTLQVGYNGTGNLTISGGLVSNTYGYLGRGSNAQGIATVSGGTWNNAWDLFIGDAGSGSSLTIETGGAVTSTASIIGFGHPSFNFLGANNAVRVNGQGSTWTSFGHLSVGNYGSNNTLTIEDGGLVKVGDALGDTISFSTNGGTNNFLRLDGGYIALFGDQTAYIGTLITAGRIQLWDGSEWVTATADKVEIAYYTNDDAGEAAAAEDTGYSGLKNYTVATVQSVPEPTAAALAALGLGALLLSRRSAERNTKTPNS